MWNLVTASEVRSRRSAVGGYRPAISGQWSEVGNSNLDTDYTDYTGWAVWLIAENSDIVQSVSEPVVTELLRVC